MRLGIHDQPGYASIFMASFAALALNREMIADKVRFFAVLHVEGRTEDWEEAEDMAAQLYDYTRSATTDLKRAWDQISAVLPGKMREVVFDYSIDFD